MNLTDLAFEAGRMAETLQTAANALTDFQTKLMNSLNTAPNKLIQNNKTDLLNRNAKQNTFVRSSEAMPEPDSKELKKLKDSLTRSLQANAKKTDKTPVASPTGRSKANHRKQYGDEIKLIAKTFKNKPVSMPVVKKLAKELGRKPRAIQAKAYELKKDALPLRSSKAKETA